MPSLRLAAAGWAGAVVICALPAAFFLGVRAGLCRGDWAGSGFRSVLAYSLPLMGVGFLYYFFTRMDILMLGHLRNTGEVGVYGLSARLAMLIPLPLEAINVIFEPTVAEHDGCHSDNLAALYKRYTPWVLGAGLAGCLILLLGTPMILELFGKEFSGGWLILGVLAIGQIINLAVGSAGVLVSMTGHSRVVLYNCLAMVALNFILNLLLIPPYGAFGAALATTIALTGINLLRLLEVNHLLGINPFSSVYWKVAALGSGIFLAAGLGWKLLGGPLGNWVFPVLLIALPGPFILGLLKLLQVKNPQGVFREIKDRLWNK